MKIELLSASDAVAYAAKLCGVEYFSGCSSEIEKTLRKLADNRYNCEVQSFENSSSAITAALAVSSFGKRTMVASDNFSIKEMQIASAYRMPTVFVDYSGKYFSYPDASFFIFSPENNQEIIDNILVAYRLCESAQIPAIIVINDSCFRESVELLTDQFCSKFLQKLKAKYDIKNPKTIVMEGNIASRYGAFDIEKNLKKMNEEMKKIKRDFEPVEKHNINDAEHVFVIVGSESSTAKSAINKMRAAGEKVGLLRLRVLRPWPEKEIKSSIAGKNVIVLDQNISFGKSGLLCGEICCECLNIIYKKRLSETDFNEFLRKYKAGERGVQFYGL